MMTQTRTKKSNEQTVEEEVSSLASRDGVSTDTICIPIDDLHRLVSKARIGCAAIEYRQFNGLTVFGYSKQGQTARDLLVSEIERDDTRRD